MPYKDLEKRKLYHRDYFREYMKNQGRVYREVAEKKRTIQHKQFKEDLILDYKLRRIQKRYGIEGLKAFERDLFSCSVCGEWDFRVLEVHELFKPFNTASNLRILCSNCHARVTFHSGENGNVFTQAEWDSHFMRVAEYYGRDSACFSRKYGVVIIKYDDLGVPYIVSLGRNGPPIGFPHCNTRNPNNEEVCPRKLDSSYKSGENLEICPAGHAERNAIMFAAREGRITNEGILYGNFNLPCKECTIAIIQAGIKEVVLLGKEEYQTRGIKSMDLFNQTGVSIRVVEEEKIKENTFKVN
jgi:deoxycytidylate deaminase